MSHLELSDKSILVIGANGSLAKETIKCLINDGARKIVMGCRSVSKGEEAKEEILLDMASAHVNMAVVGGFDMNSPEKIELAVESVGDHGPFDIIFLAAGFAVFTDDYQSIQWNDKRVEKNIFQNLIGSHFCYMFLKSQGLIRNGARVVLAGGEGVRGIKGMIDRPSFSDPQELRKYVFLETVPRYNPMNAIGVSKLCGAFWTSKISQLQQEHEVIWFSPGLTSGSAGLSHLPAAKRWFMNNILFGIFSLIGQSQTPKEGGRKFADCLEGKIGQHGDLIGAPAGKSIGRFTDQKPLNPLFTNQHMIDEFWEILMEVTHLSFRESSKVG